MKIIIKLFICLSLIYTPFFAFARAAEKWEVLSNNYDHVSNKVKIEARKITQDVANGGRYKVEVPVSPSALGKTVKTMLWTGVAVAGVEAMLEGIGWVIDHGSQVIKRPTPETMPPVDGFQYKSFVAPELDAWWNTIELAAKDHIRIMNSTDKTFFWEYKSTSHKNGVPVVFFIRCYKSNGSCLGQEYNTLRKRPAPQNLPEPQYEYLSDSALGNEIIGHGENSQPLPDAVEDAYSPNNPLTEPAPESSRQALDNANPQPETEPKGESETEPETDPETGEQTGKEKTTFELPNFCSWAPAVCDFFTVQKSDNRDIKNNQRQQIEQDKTFFEKVAEWFDWSQADDELPDNESPEIVEHVTPDLKEDAISWGASCPADVSIPISMQGVTSTLVFSWSPWCQLLSIIKPAIVASAYIGAAFIVLGLRT